MHKVALQADLWYNKLMKTFDFGGAGNTPKSEHNLSERSRYGYFIPFNSAWQATPYSPLGSWRDSTMPTPNDPQKRKGHSQSQETRDKISKSLKEQHATGKRSNPFGGSEAIAEFNRTRKQMLGKHHSPESKEKSSLSQKGRKLAEEHRLKLCKPSAKKSAAKKGRPRSPETILKMSAATKAHYAAMTPEEQAAFTERRLKSISTRNTDIEKFTARQLDILGFAYEGQKRIGRYIVDFLLPEQGLVIECNGCFWHGCDQCGYDSPKNLERRERDSKRIAYLEDAGYMVAVLWQHDLLPYMRAEVKEIVTDEQETS